MKLDFTQYTNGLIPAIIQDYETQKVLMLGYMNEEALENTLGTNKVTFYSRSKKRLWTKGEESGNFLELISIKNDCDSDALLIQAKPYGPTCHTGADTCWQEDNQFNFNFISKLETTIKDRKENAHSQESYVASLFEKGINKIAQKVGEEAIEVIIESKDQNDSLFLNEAADLFFHYLILLQAKDFQLIDVLQVLKKRQK